MLQVHRRSNLRACDLHVETMDLIRNTRNTRRFNGDAKAVPSEMSTMQVVHNTVKQLLCCSIKRVHQKRQLLRPVEIYSCIYLIDPLI